MTATNMCSNFGSKWSSPPPPPTNKFLVYLISFVGKNIQHEEIVGLQLTREEKDCSAVAVAT